MPRKTTHLTENELQDVKEIASLLDVDQARAEELLHEAKTLFLDLRYFYKEASKRERVKEIIARRKNGNDP